MIAELKQDGTLELQIKRKMPFSRQIVFDAWLDKEQLMRWMGPTSEINLGFIEVDAQQGGKYRFGFDENGCSDERSYVHGEFLEISPPSRLIFTWIWEPPLPDAGVVTVVTVDFQEIEDGTEIILTHKKFQDNASCEKHHTGWNGTLDKMKRCLKGN